MAKFGGTVHVRLARLAEPQHPAARAQAKVGGVGKLAHAKQRCRTEEP